jgi:lysozyme family protein
MNLTDALRAAYVRLFDQCQVDRGDDKRPDRMPEVKAFTQRLVAGIEQYQNVEKATRVPWYVIGLIHGLEGSFSFKTHLHNGDPLTHRTVNVPGGRPIKGDPPFTWQDSAIDALQYDAFSTWHDWTVAGICYKLEGYNGWGYRAHHINSPYLWSFSNNYERGKYVADGHWDPDAVSKQVGAIVALKQLVVEHTVNLKGVEAAVPTAGA